MKTLSLRIRGAKVELEDAGEDVDGMANSVSELQKKLLALTGGKVDIMLDENTFKSTYDIILGISKVWGNLTDLNQAALLEALAAGNCVAALDVPYNLEVIDNAGLSFSRESGSLARILRHLLTDPAAMMELRQKAVKRIESYYSWDKIINAYEELFVDLKQ